jgi:hypothetical protein
MAEQPDQSAIADPTAAASYVASLSADLASIARQHGLDTLGFLLDMARLEAENIGRPEPINGTRRRT